MLTGYVVGTVDKVNRRYFSKFINSRPYFANKEEIATLFDTRKMAEEVAAKCSDYSGMRYVVINIRAEVE